MRPDHEELLRRLALNDERAVESMLGTDVGSAGRAGLDAKTRALARVAALVAAESVLASYQWAVDAAMAVGASEEDIVDVLIEVGPIVGLARLTSAASELALALGYDIDAPEGPTSSDADDDNAASVGLHGGISDSRSQ